MIFAALIGRHRLEPAHLVVGAPLLLLARARRRDDRRHPARARREGAGRSRGSSRSPPSSCSRRSSAWCSARAMMIVDRLDRAAVQTPAARRPLVPQAAARLVGRSSATATASNDAQKVMGIIAVILYGTIWTDRPFHVTWWIVLLTPRGHRARDLLRRLAHREDHGLRPHQAAAHRRASAPRPAAASPSSPSPTSASRSPPPTPSPAPSSAWAPPGAPGGALGRGRTHHLGVDLHDSGVGAGGGPRLLRDARPRRPLLVAAAPRFPSGGRAREHAAGGVAVLPARVAAHDRLARAGGGPARRGRRSTPPRSAAGSGRWRR